MFYIDMYVCSMFHVLYLHHVFSFTRTYLARYLLCIPRPVLTIIRAGEQYSEPGAQEEATRPLVLGRLHHHCQRSS